MEMGKTPRAFSLFSNLCQAGINPRIDLRLAKKTLGVFIQDQVAI
jgi:hypothetical protein